MKVQVHCAYDEMVPTGQIKENPRNPNTHPDEQVELLARVISKAGWRAPITVSTRSGYVVRGHGRLMAARYMGLSECPVDYQDYDSDESEMQDLLADNKIAEMSIIDEGIADRILSELAESGFDIELTGFEIPEIDIPDDGSGKVVADDGADIPFATTLDEENNYIVLKFTRDIDWTNAISIFGLRKEMRLSTRKDGTVTKKMQHVSIGRVIDGVKVMNMIAGGGDHEGEHNSTELPPSEG